MTFFTFIFRTQISHKLFKIFVLKSYSVLNNIHLEERESQNFDLGLSFHG